MTEISGSCICNAVQFKLSGEPKAVVNCHCNFCRKHSGAAFSTYAVIPEETLEITNGSEFISACELKEKANKHFCKLCGSPLFNKIARYPGLCMIYLGSLSESRTLAPTANIYCESQLPWVPAIAQITNFEQGRTRAVK